MSRNGRAVIALGVLIIMALALMLWSVLGSGSDASGEHEAVNLADENRQTLRKRRPSSTYQPRRRSPGAVSATAIEDPSAGAGILEGIVLSWETNEPIVGAELTFSRGQSASSTMTDLEGGFEFRASAAGTYELATVTAEGYLPFAPEWGHSPIRLQARAGHRIRDIVIHLHPAIEYQGRVVDPQDRPVAGAVIVILSAQQGSTALAPLPERFTSDASGQFTFTAPYGALLEARHESYRPGRARVDERALYHKRLEVRLRTGEEGEQQDETISGRVVDSSGQPLEGALVVGRSAFLQARGLGRSSQAVTDEEGVFVLEGLDRGLYLLNASMDGLAPARRGNVPTGSSDVELTLRPGATLSGVVTEAQSGEPVPGFSIVVELAIGAMRRATYRTEAFFDAQGRYELSGLEPRNYSVFVSSHGYAQSEPAQITIPASEGDTTLNFTLSRGGTATGVILDADSGAPVADAQVSLEASNEHASTPVPVTARTVSDLSGRFEIRGLTAGRRSLVVTAEGYHRRLITGLEVSDEGSLGPLTVELSPTEEGEDPALELTGIGAVLSPRSTSLVIIRVLEEGGAAEVGLGPGDAILWIDGVSVTDLGFTASVERIRGPEGTSVRLSVRRRDGEEVEINVPRRRVRS